MLISNRQEDFRLSEQAAEWLFALEGDDPQVQVGFTAWLAQSARHVEEFLLVSAVFRKLDGIDRTHLIDVQQLVADAPSNVISLAETRPPAESRSAVGSALMITAAASGVGRRWLGLAVGVVALAIVLTGLLWTRGWQGYVTATGEQRILELRDGSVLSLNTRSTVEVRFSDVAREVRLIAGEASFKVAHEAARPFRVYAGGAVIQAVGTEFNVLHRSAQDTQVAVLEGRVRICGHAQPQEEPACPMRDDSGSPPAMRAPAEVVRGDTGLNAGEEARITANGQITRTAARSPARVNAWRQRRLVFDGDRLGEIAEEFNRYNRNLRIRVQDPAAAQRRLTGTFDADAPQSLMRFLVNEPSLVVTQDAGELLIRTR